MILCITIARKPLSGSVAQNVLKYGVGGLNTDGCRIETTPEDRDGMLKMSAGFVGRKLARPEQMNYGYEKSMMVKTLSIPSSKGRFPANLIISSCHGVPAMFPETTSGNLNRSTITAPNRIYGKRPKHLSGEYTKNSGSAARFFKQVKEEE